MSKKSTSKMRGLPKGKGWQLYRGNRKYMAMRLVIWETKKKGMEYIRELRNTCKICYPKDLKQFDKLKLNIRRMK